MSRVFFPLAWALGALAALWCPRLPATTFAYQSTRDLLKASDLVVVGVVTAVRYEERDGRIVTVVTLQIAETWKGAQSPGTSLEIVEPGGIVGERGSRTSGIPQYKTGDRVVTFLSTDPVDPHKPYTTTGGVPGRHLVVPAPGLSTPAASPAPPPGILARPVSDANCDYAGHDQQGRTALVDFGQMLRIEAAQKTTLDQFRAEVAAYQAAFAAGQMPPLSARDTAIQTALQAAFDQVHSTPPATAGPALPATTPAPGTVPPGPRSHAAPADLGPFVVIREEDIDRLLREQREQREQRATRQAARDSTTRNAWILFAVSGILFVGLTLFLRRRPKPPSAT